MFFNYDSFELGAIAFVVSGILIYYYSGYSVVSHAKVNNNPLLNTNSSVNSLSNIQLDNLPNHSYVDSIVQTDNIQLEASVQTANTYVNTGMQTSSRMWLESIRNWINEILTTPQATDQYVDVGVQTNVTTALQNNQSMWSTVKQWFLEVCSIRPSELSSMGYNKVNKWRNNLDPTQSVDIHDSESPLTKITFHDPNDSTLDKLVNPDDSASQVSEVISENGLQVVEGPANSEDRIYDTSNPTDLADLMNDPTVFSYLDKADNNYYFYVGDDVYLADNSWVEAILNNVN